MQSKKTKQLCFPVNTKQFTWNCCLTSWWFSCHNSWRDGSASGDSRHVTRGLHSTLNNNWHMKGVYYPLIFGIIWLVAASRWVRVHFLLLLLLRRPGLHNKSCLPPPGTWSHRTPGCGWWPTSTWPSSAPRSQTSGSTWLPRGSCPLSHPWWSPGKEGVWTFGLSLGAAVWRRETHNSGGGRLVI